MKKGIVKVSKIQGRGKTMHESGEEVQENQLPTGNFAKLVEAGKIQLIEEKQSEKKQEPKAESKAQPGKQSKPQNTNTAKKS